MHTRHLMAQVELHATLRILRLQHSRQLTIHRTQDLIQHLHDMHLHAKAVEEGGELHADHATTDNYQRGRQLFALQRLTAGPIGRLRQTRNRRNHRFRTGANQQIGRLITGIRRYNGQRAILRTSLDRGLYIDHGRTCLRHLHTDTGRQFLHHLVLAGNDLPQIKGRILRLHRIFRRMADVVVSLCRIEQGLCGNTTLVEADTSQGILLKQNGGKSTLRRTFRGGITGGTSADDRYIIFHL